jgi:surface antigen
MKRKSAVTGATRTLRSCIAACVALALSAPVLAEPPPHAKAHGWRKKNDPAYAGFRGKTWERDYGVVSLGRCNTDAVLGVAGAAIGGIIGAQVAEDSGTDRAIAVIVGSAIGAVVGAKIGRQIDRTDQACIGHALELAGAGKTVRWDNGGVAYELTPTRDIGTSCREFKLNATRGDLREATTRIACTSGNGAWELK